MDGRIYPWGDAADPNRANYHETGIGSTSAVGCFPGGVSSYSCEEMSGNVWEWGRTKWEKSYRDYQDDNDLEGSGVRVLRGGSWNNNENNVRCARRNWNKPNNRNNNNGFRLVASHIFLPCRQCQGSTFGWMLGRGIKKWRGLSVSRKRQFPWEKSQRDAWPVSYDIGRISKSHAASGNSVSERWGVATFSQ